MTARIAAIVGNPHPRSRTTTIAQAVAERLRQSVHGRAQVELIELADLGLLDGASTDWRAAVDSVLAADAVVIASPVYKASYTGLLKLFLDRFDAGSLRGVPCAAVMLGGSPAHSLAVEVHLRPLLSELGASTLPGLYVLESDLSALEELVESWWSRQEKLRRFLTMGSEGHDG